MSAKLRWVVIMLFIIILFVPEISGELTVVPQSQIALVGETVRLICSTNMRLPVNWCRTTSTELEKEIFVLNKTKSDYVAEMFVERNTTGQYNLVIKEVKVSDAGSYTCIDKAGGGDKVTAELIVLESNPKCFPGETELGFPLDNDPFQMCIRYEVEGNPVILKWREVSRSGLVFAQKIYCNLRLNQTFTCVFYVIASSNIKANNFTCFTSLSSDNNLSDNRKCPTTTINSYHYRPRSITLVPEETVYSTAARITCSADAYPSPVYNWLDSSNVTVARNTSSMVFEEPGWYECVASNELGSMQISFNVSRRIYSTGSVAADNIAEARNFVTSNFHWERTMYLSVIALLVLILIPVAYVAAKKRRKRNRYERLSTSSAEVPPPNANPYEEIPNVSVPTYAPLVFSYEQQQESHGDPNDSLPQEFSMMIAIPPNHHVNPGL